MKEFLKLILNIVNLFIIELLQVEMLKLLFNITKRFSKKNKYWFFHNQQLVNINSMEEFLSYVEKTNPDTFLKYKAVSISKREEFNAVIDYLKIDLTVQKFLDIGPAYGDSLDICYEQGAKSIDFIEIDPFFFTFNRLKQFTKGYNGNHFIELKTLEHNKYSLIWAKGAFSADRFIKRKLILHLSTWLANLELLASPFAKIIICPHWMNDNCSRRIEDVYNNYFTRKMLDEGYKILPIIKNHNHNPEYPITFYKDRAHCQKQPLSSTVIGADLYPIDSINDLKSSLH
jgi:hypothetical protein